MNLKKYIITIAMLLTAVLTNAQDVSTDSVLYANIKFEVNTDRILPNDFGLQHLQTVVMPYVSEHLQDIDSIVIIGTASPDGPYERNRQLAQMRCQRIWKEFMTYVSSSLVRTYTVSEDYAKLKALSDDDRETNKKRLLQLYHPAVRTVYVRVYVKQEQQSEQ